MTSSYKHIPKEQRKKILLICDDIRVHSGVATVAKEIVMGTAHHFNWVNLAGAIKHPEKGKRLDLSDSVNKELNISDSYIHVHPNRRLWYSFIIKRYIEKRETRCYNVVY